MVVCASSSLAKTTTSVKASTSLKAPASVKKVATPVKVAPPPCVIKVASATAINDPRVPGCTYLVVPPPKPSVVLPKSSATSSTATTSATDQAAFTPNPVGINSSASVGTISQSFFFAAIASAHSRSAIILGQPAQVSFTPVSIDWSADDGSTGSGSSFTASWASEGSHGIGLSVGYSVSYSLGAGWIDAGIITSSAATSVTVGAAPTLVAAKPTIPLLVSGNCRLRPGSYRC